MTSRVLMALTLSLVVQPDKHYPPNWTARQAFETKLAAQKTSARR
jgi:hypothetical protein